MPVYMVDHIYALAYICAMNISADEYFAAMASPIRLRCMALLVQEEELCVCELMHALGMSQPMISRHLAHLRKSGLVQDRREGQWIYYRMHQDLSGWIEATLHTTVDGIKANAPYFADREMLADMPNRPGTSCCA